MPIAFNCQSCDRSLRVKDELAGAQIYCPDCKSILTVPAADEAIPAHAEESITPLASPAAEYDEEFSPRAEAPDAPPVESEGEASEPNSPKYPPMRKGPNVGAILGGLALMGAAGVIVLVMLGAGWAIGHVLKLIVVLFIAGAVTFIKGLAGRTD